MSRSLWMLAALSLFQASIAFKVPSWLKIIGALSQNGKIQQESDTVHNTPTFLDKKIATSLFKGMIASIMLTPGTSSAAEQANSAIVQQLSEIKETVAEGSTLQSQIQMLRLQETNSQKEALDAAIQDLTAKELLYDDGYLLARGSVVLESAGSQSLYPFGLSKASDVDAVYADENAALYLLAVGREGPPVAAKRYLLKDLSFPLAFELTAKDLIFPYTAEAWLNTPGSRDSIAMTAIITVSPKLSVSTGTERFGFGVSDPTTFAGKFCRTTASIRVLGKIDKVKYTDSEVELLSNIDRAIEQQDASKSVINAKTAASVKK